MAFHIDLLELITLQGHNAAPNATAWAETLEIFWKRRQYLVPFQVWILISDWETFQTTYLPIAGFLTAPLSQCFAVVPDTGLQDTVNGVRYSSQQFGQWQHNRSEGRRLVRAINL